LGLQTAKALVASGARHIVLTGRSGANGQIAAIRELESSGAKVRVVRADVSRPEDVNRLFGETLAAMPPLAGLIHSAGVIDDALLSEQSLKRLRNVMAPKVDGAWNLHLHTKDLTLDFFVCFSSAASMVGSPGQANYAAANAFLDALAHHRRFLGLPGLSINWGAWSGDGMAAEQETRRRMAARGVAAIDRQQGISLLLSLLNSAGIPPQIGVLPVNWNRFLEQFPDQVPSLFRALGEPRHRQRNFRQQLDSAPLEERQSMLRIHLAEALASVLGFASAERIAPRQRFFDLGMDSLTALEFRKRLESALAIKLPATSAFDYPTLEALGSHLASLLIPLAQTPPGEDLASLSDSEIARLLRQELAEEAVDAH